MVTTLVYLSRVILCCSLLSLSHSFFYLSSTDLHICYLKVLAKKLILDMLVRMSNAAIAVLVCYENPVYEEEEQELPILRWIRHFHVVPDERCLDQMTLITISEDVPIVQHGSLYIRTGQKEKLYFRDETGKNVSLELLKSLNDSIEHQFQCQGQLSAVPIWSGKEVVLGRLTMLDHEDEVSGVMFAKEWIGILCVSFFQVTQMFLKLVAGTEKPEMKPNQKGARKSPKPSQNMFWIWWPPLKPRDLRVFLREACEAEKIDTTYFKRMSPTIPGIYRTSIAQVTSHNEISWVMKLHADREAVIPIFIDPEEKSTMEDREEYKSGSDEIRVIFNRNFALKSGHREGVNVYGIFGSMSYISAQLLPYTKDNVCPMLPCLSPWVSLQDFKRNAAESKAIPDGIMSRAKRIWFSMKEVLVKTGELDDE